MGTGREQRMAGSTGEAKAQLGRRREKSFTEGDLDFGTEPEAFLLGAIPTMLNIRQLAERRTKY